MVNIKSA